MKPKITPRRRALYGKIQIAIKSLSIDDDSYRDLLNTRYDKRSRIDLTDSQLVDLVEHFKTLGFKPTRPKRTTRNRSTDSETTTKMRALWHALYNLGAVNSAGEPALVAFVKRQTGVDALQFVRPQQAFRVIEALKDWATRTGVDWAAHENPRRAVIDAQWQRLLDLGAIHSPEGATAQSFGYRATGKAAFQFYDNGDYDQLMDALGGMIRRAKRSADA